MVFSASFNTSNANSSASYPFTAFNFSVEIQVEGVASRICNAAFAECEGLEMTMEPKTIREGGNNATQIHLAGPVAYGQLTLRRGMTANFDLWSWFTRAQSDPTLRADAQVVMLTPDHEEAAVFALRRCLPIKVKAPTLNAKDGVIAIEEFQLAYESLTLKGAEGGGIGFSASVSIGGGGISASAGISL
jgi:phage tail-like protein